MASQHLKIDVRMKHLDVGTHSDGRYQAVDEFSDGLAADTARPVQRCGTLIVCWTGRQHRRSGNQTSKLIELAFISSSGEKFHRDHIAYRKIVAE